MKPTFTKELEAKKAREGEVIKFEVNFNSVPAPIISWYKDGYQIQSSKDFIVEGSANLSSLTMREGFISDSGVYQVKLFNEVGVAQSKCYLKVLSSKFISFFYSQNLFLIKTFFKNYSRC